MTEGLSKTAGVVLQIAVPPELVDIGVAPDLQRFFDAMVYKLRRNSHKGRWEDLKLEDAIADLRGECEELDFAAANGSTSEILMEAADVANEALIVAAIALEAKTGALATEKPAVKQPDPPVNRSESAGDEQQQGHGDA